MFRVKPSWIEQSRAALRLSVLNTRTHRQRLARRGRDLRFLMTASVIACVSSLCLVTPALAQDPNAILSTIPGGTPPINAAGFAIGTLCPPLAMGRSARGSGAFTGAQNDLIDRCTEMVVNGGQQSTLNPLLQVSSFTVPTEGTSQVEAARVQIANIIGLRLPALRAGATGISVEGLAFNINGKTLPGTMLASLLPGNDSRDVTNAYAPTIFPKFEASTSLKTSPRTMLANLLAQAKSDGTGSSGSPSRFDKLGAFANGTFTWGDKDQTSREAGFDFDTLGMTAGVDYRFTDQFIFGTAFGFASTDADLDLSGGNIDTKQYSGSIYGTYYFERLYVDGIMTIGWNTFDSKRNIVYSIPPRIQQGVLIPGATTQVNQTAKADTDGPSYSLGFGGGYEFRSGGFTFGPYGRLNYFKLDIDGYGESIDNTNDGFGLALEFRGQTLESLTTALGGQATYALSTQVAVFVPQLLFEWVHEFLNNRRLIAANYVNDPMKVPLNYRPDGPDRNFFNLGLGMSAVFRRGTSAFIYYQTALAFEDITKNDIVVGVRLAF
jgi:outer membrane autotransporter protein